MSPEDPPPDEHRATRDTGGLTLAILGLWATACAFHYSCAVRYADGPGWLGVGLFTLIVVLLAASLWVGSRFSADPASDASFPLALGYSLPVCLVFEAACADTIRKASGCWWILSVLALPFYAGVTGLFSAYMFRTPGEYRDRLRQVREAEAAAEARRREQEEADRLRREQGEQSDREYQEQQRRTGQKQRAAAWRKKIVRAESDGVTLARYESEIHELVSTLNAQYAGEFRALPHDSPPGMRENLQATLFDDIERFAATFSSGADTDQTFKARLDRARTESAALGERVARQFIVARVACEIERHRDELYPDVTHKDLLDLRNRSADPYEIGSTFRNSAQALLDRIRKLTEVQSPPAPPSPPGTPPGSPDEAAIRDLETRRDAQIEAVRSSDCDAHQIEGEIDYITQTFAVAIAKVRRGDR